MSKHTDHNGKEAAKTKGKNIRISEAGWNKIRKYCSKNGVVMGAFVEGATLIRINELSMSKK